MLLCASTCDVSEVRSCGLHGLAQHCAVGAERTSLVCRCVILIPLNQVPCAKPGIIAGPLEVVDMASPREHAGTGRRQDMPRAACVVSRTILDAIVATQRCRSQQAGLITDGMLCGEPSQSRARGPGENSGGDVAKNRQALTPPEDKLSHAGLRVETQ